MNINVNSILSKVEKNLDTLGTIGGAYSTLSNLSDVWGQKDAFATGEYILQGLIKNPHMPNLSEVLTALRERTESKTFMPAVKAAIIGYMLKETKLHPTLTRIGRALEKGGVGIAKGSALVTLLVYSGVAASPPDLSMADETEMYNRVFKNTHSQRNEPNMAFALANY